MIGYKNDPTYLLDSESREGVRHSRYRNPEPVEVNLELDPSTKLDVWFRYLKERTSQGYTPDQIARMWEEESKKHFKN